MTHTFFGSASDLKARGLQLLRLHDAQHAYGFGPRSSNRVVFFDIDDTLLLARGAYSRQGWTFFPAIRPIVELCRASHALGLRVVIITARPDVEGNRAFTEQELEYHRIPYDLLYMCPPSVRNYAGFKAACRRDALGRLQCEPLFSIGDREWDIGHFGGYGLLIDS